MSSILMEELERHCSKYCYKRPLIISEARHTHLFFMALRDRMALVYMLLYFKCQVGNSDSVNFELYIARSDTLSRESLSAREST